jgi:tetratricopeptide (TPR) repeat protein
MGLRRKFSIGRQVGTGLFIVNLVCLALVAAQNNQAPQGGDKQLAARMQIDFPPSERARLMPGLGNVHHPVTTNSLEAQRFFDQGLMLHYGFNEEGADQSFRRAAELDPGMAMAYWGMALDSGPLYIRPGVPVREKIPYENIQKAMALRAKFPEHERAYIEALSQRYTDAPNPDYRRLNLAYRDAMRELSKRYPDDLDAAALYAESMMIAESSFTLWNVDGTPREGTPEIVAVLESVLRRDPDHIGAIHYYIHAVDASPHPEQALAAANRLASLAPGEGHLLHMPSHTYMQIGDYDAAARANVEAARADENYVKSTGAHTRYADGSYVHDLELLVAASDMEGRHAQAEEAANRVFAFADSRLDEYPFLEHLLPTPLIVMLRFERWDDILEVPQPDASRMAASWMWHYARGMALAAKGRVEEAAHEREILAAVEAKTPKDAIFRIPFTDTTKSIIEIAGSVLDANIAAAKQDNPGAIRLFEKAVALQDHLGWSEPPDWYYPVRESLGTLLLKTGQYEHAEQVFREDLKRSPRNGRSLFGLAESLAAQGRSYEAELVRQQFQTAWKNADTPLKNAIPTNRDELGDRP